MIAVQCCLQWWQSANCWEVSPVCRHGQTSMKGVDSLKLLLFFFFQMPKREPRLEAQWQSSIHPLCMSSTVMGCGPGHGSIGQVSAIRGVITAYHTVLGPWEG